MNRLELSIRLFGRKWLPSSHFTDYMLTGLVIQSVLLLDYMLTGLVIQSVLKSVIVLLYLSVQTCM
jgi:hypothetical protein